MAETRRTLADACTPLFLFLSTFWRNSASSRATLIEVKEQLRAQFEQLRADCMGDPRLASKFERAHYALVAAADQIILSSNWPQRAQWTTAPLEKDLFKKLEGGKRFFRLVEEIIEDPSEEAPEIAECLFICVALGFRGELIGEKKQLEKTRRGLFEKARLAGVLGKRLTPDAYGRNIPGKPVVLPTTNIVRLVAVTVAALAFMVASVFLTQYVANQDLIEAADEIATALENQKQSDSGDLKATVEALERQARRKPTGGGAGR
jgi:type IV/VI secretion system ImpK/VasF family protein